MKRHFTAIGSLTDSQELDVLCYILVVSIGLSILFYSRTCLFRRPGYRSQDHEQIPAHGSGPGHNVVFSGMCVALSAALVYDKKTVVLSILGTYFNGIILDHFIFNHNVKRRVCIITKKEEALRRFIVEDLPAVPRSTRAIGCL
ncbi:MAG: YitT family protein [Clostridium sp.]